MKEFGQVESKIGQVESNMNVKIGQVESKIMEEFKSEIGKVDVKMNQIIAMLKPRDV